MRQVRIAATGILLISTALFPSCTCHQQVEPPPTLQQPKSGFPVAVPKDTPVQRAQAPTATITVNAPPQEMAQAGPTATPVVKIPDDFPADVPVFKDATVSQVQNLANNAHSVIFRTPVAVDTVTSFYQETMTKGGWKVSQQFTRSNHSFMTFQKGDMQANVTVAEDLRNPGQQVIAIMYEKLQAAGDDDF